MSRPGGQPTCSETAPGSVLWQWDSSWSPWSPPTDRMLGGVWQRVQSAAPTCSLQISDNKVVVFVSYTQIKSLNLFICHSSFISDCDMSSFSSIHVTHMKVDWQQVISFRYECFHCWECLLLILPANWITNQSVSHSVWWSFCCLIKKTSEEDAAFRRHAGKSVKIDSKIGHYGYCSTFLSSPSRVTFGR